MAMHKCFAFLVPLALLTFMGPVQARDLERDNLTGVMEALDEVERLWNDQDIEGLTLLIAEPFNLITPDGVYRRTYFRAGVHKLLSRYVEAGTDDALELAFSSFSMLTDHVAYLEATGSLGEKDIVISAILRKFGDDWKAHNVHISDLSEEKTIRDEEGK